MSEVALLIAPIIVAGLIVIGLVLWFYRDNLFKGFGCLAAMAGALILGAGVLLYELESLFGGRARGMPVQEWMMFLGAVLLGLGALLWLLGVVWSRFPK